MRPIYDLASFFAAQIHTAEEESGRVYEPLVGVVTDNRDPQRLGRVRVKFPVLSEHEASHWAPIVMPGAGRNRGWFLIPEVGDEVLVMFEHGDMNHPVVVGALWNGKDRPPDRNPGRNPRRVIRSRRGSRIIFDDAEMKLVIEDGTGKSRITLDANKNKIVLEALDGDVCVQTPRGETQIVARSAAFTARKNVEIHAGESIACGADASGSIRSGEGVALSGAKVNLNCGIARAPEPPESDPRETSDPYEARGESGESDPSTSAQMSPPPPPPPSTSPTTPFPETPVKRPASDVTPLELQPILVSATWSQERTPISTSVVLSAVCGEMSGIPATFTIRDTDGERGVVATLHATCGEGLVEARWTTPSNGPPVMFAFEVEAGGKQSTSGALTLVKRVKAKLVLDDEPAFNVQVELRSEATGELLSGTTDEDGIVVFEEAALGAHRLVLRGDT